MRGRTRDGRRACLAQEELIDRMRAASPPPALDDMETDANGDGIPDGGWYNGYNAKLIAEGGAVGPHFVRFESTRPGRAATLSRGFGLDGKKIGAIKLGLWVRRATSSSESAREPSPNR